MQFLSFILLIYSEEFTIDINMYVCMFLKLHLKQITVVEHKINNFTPYST